MFIAPPPLPATKILGPFIAEWEGVWSGTDEMIQEIEKITSDPLSGVKFETATVIRPDTGLREVGSYRTNSTLSLSLAAQVNDFMRDLNNLFYFTINQTIEWYRKEFNINEEMFHVEGYNLLKYQTGQEYKAHYDGGTSLHRAASPILYLNSDYEGGEIEFVNYGLTVKPKPGSMYIFPPFYTHQHIAHPVTEGTKYAIVTWLHDTPQQSH